MAEVLVRAAITTSLSRGDILAIMPDGHQWGTEELSNRFYRITITGATVQDLESWLEQSTTGSIEVGDYEIVHKRRYNLNSTICDTIEANGGEYTVASAGAALAVRVDKDA